MSWSFPPPCDEIMEGVLDERNVAGGSLAIAKRGRLVLARGYGLAVIKTRRPVTPETLFCIASVTKAISADAALRLVDERKLHSSRDRARRGPVVRVVRPGEGLQANGDQPDL